MEERRKCAACFVDISLVVRTPEVAPAPSHRVTCDGWSALMQPIRALRVTLRHMPGSANKILTRRHEGTRVVNFNVVLVRCATIMEGLCDQALQIQYLRVVWVLTLFMFIPDHL
jgi:hypothetical protein